LLFSALTLCLLPHPAALSNEAKRFKLLDRSDFLDRYDPGIPESVSLTWDLPSGLSLGISAGHKLHGESPVDPSLSSEPKTDLFPLSFLMMVPLYETPLLSQSMGFGIGPCFLHQGQMPIEMGDMEVTGMTTYLTEWVSQISDNLFLQLRMKYTQAFESMQDRLPDRVFSTWLGLKAHW